MNVLAEVIGNRSTAALEFFDQNTATENLQTLTARKSVEKACIYDVNDEVFAKYSKTKNKHCPKVSFQKSEFKDNRLYVFKYIYINGDRIGTIALISDL